MGNEIITKAKRGNKVVYTLNVANTVFYIATIALVLMFSNLGYMCLFMFQCSQIIPTISYTGLHLGLDRILIIAGSLLMTAVIQVQIGGYLQLRNHIDGVAKFVLITAGLATNILLQVTVHVDELNGLHVFILREVHIFCSLSLLVITLGWCYLLLAEYGDCDLVGDQAKALARCNKLFWFILICGVIEVAQWFYGKTIYSNALVNESIEAIFEWALVVAAAYSPYFLARLYGKFEIQLEVETASQKLTKG